MTVMGSHPKTTGYKSIVKNHPCFGGEANINCGRIHLPVSPECNIKCRFCKRCFNKSENRPGVSSTLLSPAKSLEIIEKALKLCPEITVVGIAGPGDTLATDHALETFEKVHNKFPDLINCLSTNGLLLKEKAKRIINAGVKTLTVTVNAVEPEILEKICSYIQYHDRVIYGREAAATLINAQLSGISDIAGLGAVVKINAVLVPGVNDEHIGEVARVTSSAGASIIT
jgi:nitrogen fixation protein NifB